jgi:hypothetical protein
MTLNHQLVALNASTATILTVPFASEPEFSATLTISIQNANTSTVYLGASNVTASSYGYALAPGSTFTADLLPNDEIYAIVATGTPNVAVMRVIH